MELREFENGDEKIEEETTQTQWEKREMKVQLWKLISQIEITKKKHKISNIIFDWR